MSLFSALSTSLSGLQAAQTQLQLTANNISNANQDGYTRKSVVQAAITLGTEGGGTQITGYNRATDQALSVTTNKAISNSGLRSTQDDYLKQVQTILGATTGDNPPISDAVAAFSSAWQQLAAAPESNTFKTQVVQAAKNLVNEVQTASTAVESLDRQSRTEISDTLTTLNADLTSIADLNKKISAAVGAGLDAGNLQDERDRMVSDVASMMSITVLPRQQGQIALYTSGGYMLMDGSAQSFSYNGANITAASDPTQSLNGTLTGGKIQALVDFRSQSTPPSADPAVNVIQKLRDQLDAIAQAFTTSSAGPPATFAYAYANATGQTGEATSIFDSTGTDRFSFAVNSSLLDGTETIKTASAGAVADTFTDTSKTFTADGLSVVNASYETLATTILSNFQQAANNISQLNDQASQQTDYLKQRLANETGVNVDTETVNLTALQNAYAASAHVISVVNQMFSVLENVLAG